MPEALTLKLSGPLFAGSASGKVQAAAKQGLLKVALAGQRLVQEQLTHGHGVKSGYFRRSIGGFLQPGEALAATVRSNPPDSEQVIYTGWLESGPHGRQHAGRFSGYGMFQDAATKLAALDFNAMLGSAIVAQLEGGSANAAD